MPSNWHLFIWCLKAREHFQNYVVFFLVRSSIYYEFSCFLFGKIWQCTHFARTNTFCLQCPRAPHALRLYQLICRLVLWPRCRSQSSAFNFIRWVERFRDLFRRLRSAQLWKIRFRDFITYIAHGLVLKYIFIYLTLLGGFYCYLSVFLPIFQDLKLKP